MRGPELEIEEQVVALKKMIYIVLLCYNVHLYKNEVMKFLLYKCPASEKLDLFIPDCNVSPL